MHFSLPSLKIGNHTTKWAQKFWVKGMYTWNGIQNSTGVSLHLLEQSSSKGFWNSEILKTTMARWEKKSAFVSTSPFPLSLYTSSLNLVLSKVKQFPGLQLFSPGPWGRSLSLLRTMFSICFSKDTTTFCLYCSFCKDYLPISLPVLKCRNLPGKLCGSFLEILRPNWSIKDKATKIRCLLPFLSL